MKIVADANIPFINHYFGHQGELVLKPGRSIHSVDVRDADLLLVRSITRVDQALLDKSKVKFVGSFTAGADHLDTQWLDANGILWATAAGFNAPPVADYVVSVIVALRNQQLLTRTLSKAAVIGVGHVGCIVAKRLALLGFEVVLIDPIRSAKDADFQSKTIHEISGCDFITLHVPLTFSGEHKTYHFIDATFLEQQRSGCVLLNTSRGAVINSAHLLNAGKHLYWCLDVWEDEPSISKDLLKQALIATPHIAGYSVQSKLRGIEMIYQIAKKKGLIKANVKPIVIPHQQLKDQSHWQDIILSIFNPLIVTDDMKSQLLPSTDHGHLFDEMRNQFNNRYEFNFVDVDIETLTLEDQAMWNHLRMV